MFLMKKIKQSDNNKSIVGENYYVLWNEKRQEES